MKPLAYHAGQRAVQDEAQTRRVADKLADWVGPVPDFARGADLVVLAMPENGTGLRFALLSGAAPLVRLADGPELRLGLPAGLAAHVQTPTACGGLVISLGLARRARVNGFLCGRGDYRNTRADRGREDALVQHREDHPQQGVMRCTIERAERLRDVLHPRRRIDRVPRITSRSTVPEQKPQ